MLESVLDRDSLDGIKSDHLHDKIETLSIEVFEVLGWVSRSELGEGFFVVLQLENSRPDLVFFSGSSVELEDFEDLIDFGVSHEEGFLFDHFSEDASCGPHINSKRVLLLPHQNFWRSVPESFDFVSESFNRDSESSGETKIGDLDISFLVNQDILWLEISMDDSSGVTEIQTVQNLEQVEFNLIETKIMFILIKIFL